MSAAQGVRFCTYYSIIDWHHPDYLPRGPGDHRPAKGAEFNRYFTFMKGQLRELVENYHPAVMWFDGDWDNNWTVARGREVYAMLRKLDPAIIVNNRLSKGRSQRLSAVRYGPAADDRRRLRHARAGNRPLFGRPQRLLGKLHDALPAMGLEAR